MRELSENPFQVFAEYYSKFQASNPPEPTAMILSTIGLDGFPNSRVVLLKQLDQAQGGFIFFSNYSSSKGLELESNPKASLVFFWPEIQMQVRVQGSIQKLSRQESEEYFRGRPRLSQIGAWASEQSQQIPNYDWLKKRTQEFEQKFAGGPVPCPEDWGGYLLKPKSIEFWFAHEGRLHERYIYELQGQSWRQFMKSP